MKKRVKTLWPAVLTAWILAGMTAAAQESPEHIVVTYVSLDGAPSDLGMVQDAVEEETEAFSEAVTEAVTEAVSEGAAQDGQDAEAASEEGTADLSDLILAEDDPDFSAMTIEEWGIYEFNRDYATIMTDVTSYDHDFLRKFLDSHWSTFIDLGVTAPDTRTVSDEEARARLIAHHNMRMEALQSVDQDAVEARRIYLWPEGQVPSVTEYTENEGYAYADWPGFEPFMLEMLVDEGTEVKGAVIIAPGGGHMYRSNVEEGYEVAQALNEQGYQCFILNYRVDPYTDEESALDVARAVKIVRANAEEYGIPEDRIACAGFSYGGIVSSLAADIYAGDTNASALVESYVPDEIDAVSSDVNAYLAIYSVTPDEITNENFPATFFAFGSDDANLWDWGTRCFNLVRDTGIQTEIHTYAGVPHGFGAGTDAGNNYYANAATWPMLADCFLDNVYANADAAEAAAAEETTEAAAEEATETVTEEATETDAE